MERVVFRRVSTSVKAVLLGLSAVIAAACGGSGGGGDTAMPDGTPMMTEGTADGMGGMGGGMGGALGGSAETELLAETTIDALPDGPLAWTAFPVSGVQHAHAPSFVHARDATTIAIDGQQQQLAAGEAVFVPGGVTHTHGGGTAWDVLLAAPDVAPPEGVDGEPIFRSDTLEGLPSGEAQLRALLVELPPGSQTSVHTHPGPEYIYATSGPFIYQNAIIGEERTTEGDDHTLPAGTAVQKRNPEGSDTAAFLSWFIVAPDQPFAPAAEFEG